MAPIPDTSPKAIFLRLVEELKEHSGTEIVTGPKLPAGAGKTRFVSAKTNSGIEYAPGITSFYESLNGFHLSWKFGKAWGGEINILDIGALTQGYFDDFWKEELAKLPATDDGQRFRQFAQELNSLEVFDDTTDGTLRTVLQLRKNAPEPQSPPLWLWNLAGEKYPLSLGFEQYWPRLAQTRGFAGWPYFFIDLAQCHFDDPYFRQYFAQSAADAIPSMQRFLKHMPALFPQDDFSEFEALFQKIQASLK